MRVRDEQAAAFMLSDGERRLREALDASPDGFAVYVAGRNASGEVDRLSLDFINAAGVLGFAGDTRDILGEDPRGFFPEMVETGIWDCAVEAADGDGPRSVRVETYGDHWPGILDVRWVRMSDDRLLATWRDVTDEVISRRESAEAQATLQTALDATSDAFAVYEVDREGDEVRLRMLMANLAAAEPLNLTPVEMVGLDVRDFFPQAERCGLWRTILESLATSSPKHVRIHVVDEADGRWLTSWDNTVAPVGTERVVLTWRDATEEERAVRALARAHDDALHSATHDPLTGLPNRRLLQERLAVALDGAGHGERLAVVFLDLDEFKDVNDTWGHATGDEVLRAVGNRLDRLIRHGDTAARLGGDEFVLLLRDLGPDWDAMHFVHRVQALVSAPVPLPGRGVLHPGVSVGIALCPPAAPEVEHLLDLADSAMYRAKTRRREAREQEAMSS